MSTKKERQERLEQVKEAMCDRFCKMPAEYLMLYEDSEVAMDTMLEDMCSECPLNDLME